MTRNSNSEVLVPIAEIAGRLLYLPEMVTGRIKQPDIRPDWDGAPAVPWSVAKATFETLAAEKAAHDHEQYARMNEQMDREQHAREYPLRAYADASRHHVIDGVQVSVPGEPEPPGMGE